MGYTILSDNGDFMSSSKPIIEPHSFWQSETRIFIHLKILCIRIFCGITLQNLDTEQHVANRTGGKENVMDAGGFSEDDRAQAAATSHEDEDPKVDNDNDNQITNVQSQTDIDRTEREGESLHTRDSPEDRSKDNATHAGTSRVETVGGTDIITDSGPEAEGQVNEVVSSTDNDIEDSE
ncbi:hypothetical protein K435DRAFT_880355 [Dendrothele bispora CBS 962.96]|uniref:Uncharacterized protein n=1 Tax=Dendrothele bispora (strain CBS 962.96) TaxID=1314807 RepID=A0A4S8KKK4_DENBC|nr:hypothetical protein K435DRAFT_880355 [Dendrothele bispora CBS 962.96]